MRKRNGIFAAGLACVFAASVTGANAQIGYIDEVRKVDGYWAIKGWTCQPGLGSAIQASIFLNDQPYGVPQYSSEPAEAAVHDLCGTTVSSGVPYRYTLHYSGPITGQLIRVDAIGTASAVSLNGSNQFGLPVIDPESVIASANRILVLTAHEDDEVWFSPMIGKYCGVAGKTCRVVTTTSNRTYHPNPNEFVNAMALLPAVYDRGTFTSGDGVSGFSHDVLATWNGEAAAWGLIDANNVVKLEIDKFVPDVILTFDPRHGTTCHTEHRAVGQAVIDGVNAYSGVNFNKSNLFLLESRMVNNYSGSVTAVPKDQFSVAYDMANYLPPKSMTGFDFLINMIAQYPSQPGFGAAGISAMQSSDITDRVTSFMPISNYNVNDPRYIGQASDPRIQDCGAF